MISFNTRSGSRYQLDATNKSIRRVSGNADPTNRQGKDGEWRKFEETTEPTIGFSLVIVWSQKTSLLVDTIVPEGCFALPTTMTSPITHIEEANSQ